MVEWLSLLVTCRSLYDFIKW